MQLLIRDVVKLFRVNERTVHEWIGKKHLPSSVVDRQRRFNPVELLEWALDHNVPFQPRLLFLNNRSGAILMPEALKRGGIHYDVPGVDRAAVLRAALERTPLPPEADRTVVLDMLLARERLESTAIGHGIALPHLRNPIVLGVERPQVALCFLKTPVEFGAIDHRPVSVLFFMINPSVKVHLLMLSRLAACLQDPRLIGMLDRRDPPEKLTAEFLILESKLVAKEIP